MFLPLSHDTYLYVILQIRPKCHYCRNSLPSPWVECTRCTNRIIVPPHYRTLPDSEYSCPACDNSSKAGSRDTIVVTETTTRAVVAENGVSWLGLPSFEDILTGKSAFKLMQAHGKTVFKSEQIDNANIPLAINSRKVQDSSRLLAQVEKRVGTGEVELGSCTLCFDEMPRGHLIAACGRSGCKQRVDDECLRQWVRIFSDNG